MSDDANPSSPSGSGGSDESDGSGGDAVTDPFLRVLAEHWDDVMRRAATAPGGLVRQRLIALITNADAQDAVDVRAELAIEADDLLPADHPVIRALHDYTLHGSPREISRSLTRVRALIGRAPAPATDDLVERVKDRLRRLPSLSPQDLPDGVDAAGGLIRLTDGERLTLPSFQFDSGGTPFDIVLQTNRMLGAAGDPWGVTSWWVYPHALLDGAPADLIGRDDALLIALAQRVGED